MSCYSSIYETWKDTLHNKSQEVLSRTNDTLVVDRRVRAFLFLSDPQFIIRPGMAPTALMSEECSRMEAS